MKIWDLKPDGGGAPVQIDCEPVDVAEFIARDPKRYARERPDDQPTPKAPVKPAGP